MALQITNCKTYVKDKTGNTQILNNVKKKHYKLPKSYKNSLYMFNYTIKCK